MITVLLDAGHGGIINGEYQTSGKRSPKWEDGSVLYEGEFNRAIKYRLKERLQEMGIPFVDVNPGDTDISLQNRCNLANEYSNSLYVSIHANAGGGTGCEVFTAENCSNNSMQMAMFVADEYKKRFSERWRGIKKKDFYVVKHTKMPAVLIECFFMDTEKECKAYLMTRDGRDTITEWILHSILKYVKWQS